MGRNSKQRRDAKRAKERKREISVSQGPGRPERFQHQGRRGLPRRALFIAVLIVLAAALVIPTFVSLNLVGKSVPSITPSSPNTANGTARLVTDTTP